MPGQTGATTEPTTRPLRTRSCRPSREIASSLAIEVDVRMEQEQIDAVELLAVDLGRGRQVEHRIEVDRRLSVPGPLPTRPGHMAL